MKAEDISDEALIDAILTVRRVRWDDNPGWIGSSIWDIAAVLDGHPEWRGGAEATDGSVQIPLKVVRAKAKKLVRRGLIDGCADHECRGDFTVNDADVQALRALVALTAFCGFPPLSPPDPPVPCWMTAAFRVRAR